MSELGFTDLGLCVKAGNILAWLNEQNERVDTIEMIKKWLSSKTFWHYLDFDVSVFTQGYRYIGKKFLQEQNAPLSTGFHITNQASIKWVGYLFCYWYLMFDKKPCEIAEEYDIDYILGNFDTLHTISLDAAIREICKEGRNYEK